MKLLFDLFPVLLFFIAYKFAGIYVATGVAIAATVLQIAWVWWRHQKVDTMLWVSLVIIAVFGGATLAFHNETFIKWKPTVLYWLFASTLLGASMFFRKNLMQSMLKDKLALPEPGWRLLNLSWAIFFAVMGLANLFVAYTFSTDTWVNFKLFGSMGLMFVFVLIQGALLSKYIQEEDK